MLLFQNAAVLGLIGVATALLGEGWSELFFGGPGSYAIGYASWSSDSASILSLADTGEMGDTYTIYNWGVAIAVTSTPNPQAANSTTFNPEVALSTPLGWSKAQFLLDPGDYEVTIQVNAEGYVDAGAYIRIDRDYAI